MFCVFVCIIIIVYVSGNSRFFTVFLSVVQVTNLSASMSEAELRARAAAEHGLPLTQHMLSGTIPMYPSLLGKLQDTILFHNYY